MDHLQAKDHLQALVDKDLPQVALLQVRVALPQVEAKDHLQADHLQALVDKAPLQVVLLQDHLDKAAVPLQDQDQARVHPAVVVS